MSLRNYSQTSMQANQLSKETSFKIQYKLSFPGEVIEFVTTFKCLFEVFCDTIEQLLFIHNGF